MNDELKKHIREAVRSIDADNLGVAFSGGVDSSLLAKVCKDEGKAVTALTVGFINDRDIRIAEETANAMRLKIVNEVVSLEDLEEGLMDTLRVVETERISCIENSVCFYFVFRLASRHGIRVVASANGLDELFCGYNIYKESFGDELSVKRLMENLVKTAYEDMREIEKVSNLFGVKYVCPFLFEDFVKFAKELPIKSKILGKDDGIRKHMLRQVALEMGVPEFAAFRVKKAFQYSSGLDKAVRTLAKIRGFTKEVGKAMGFASGLEAYIKTLKSKNLVL
ncbi:MAG: asparagine synthase-related protein [Nitrososphaerota archaeon]|nr:asparagine synthase-related protein [Candidatus Bathyarchaeota archaeon]MDW8049104.1 asparagine synthase-related protein [Nitrososphaerota archaeon]